MLAHYDRKATLLKCPHASTGHPGTLCFRSFRKRACRLFNHLPKSLRNISNYNITVSKSKINIFLKTIEDTLGVPNRSNSLFDLIKETVRGGYGIST